MRSIQFNINRSSIRFLLLFVAVTVAGSMSAQLTPVSLEARIAESDLIVEGRIIAQEASWDVTHSTICTINTLLISKVLDGEVSEDHVKLITRGGQVGLVKEEVTHSLQVEVGEYGLFTLQPSYFAMPGVASSYRASAGAQGFIRYQRDAAGAHNVFEDYSSVEQELYPLMESAIGHPYELRSAMQWRTDESATPQFGVNMMAITSFSPTTCPAGARETIVIQGSGFGNTPGTVRFSNADDGGATFVDGLASDILSWTDTQIEVVIDEQAGTGPIQVGGPTPFTSSESLLVPYAQINVHYDPDGGGDRAYQTQHVDDNAAGGYTWQMQTDFSANAPAVAAFSRAMDRWVNSTCINWTIGDDTTIDVIASDGTNVIRFDNGNELNSGTLGVCTSRFSGCFVGGDLQWYVNELDIVFDDATNWNFSTDAPGFTEYDFESVAVHELGHGHQLGHVIDASKVMHYSIGNGDENREIASNELEGATDVMTRSTTVSHCGQGVMTDSDTCCNAPEAPTVDASEETVCPGGTSTLTITGELNSATAWHVYSGSCGGTLIGTTTSTIDVGPATTTTYFVRGEDGGGCVDEGAAPCTTVTINTGDDTAPVLTCPADETILGDSGCTAPIPDYTSMATATDNCSGPLTLTQSPAVGSIISGTQVVTITAVDQMANSTQCQFTVTVTADASFSYAQEEFCANGPDVFATVSGAGGGTFSSSPLGLAIDASTGTIIPSSSNTGVYTVTYTVSPAGCNGSHQEQVTILDGSSGACGGAGVADQCNEAIAVPTLLHGAAEYTAAPLSSGPPEPGCAGDADDAVWFSFVAGSPQDVLYARDPSGQYDVVIEVYENCAGSVIACGNNYGAGQTERFAPGGLTTGEQYLVRLYDAATGAGASTTVELMVNTFAESNLLPAYCDRLDYTLTDVIMTERDQWGQLYDEPAVQVLGYAFRVMEGSTEVATRYINAVDGFYTPLFAIGDLAYDTEYEVSVSHKVSVQVNGGTSEFWSEFGTPCTIGLESNVPTPNLRAAYCDAPGTFGLGSYILSDQMYGADLYQFVFVNGSDVHSKIAYNYSLFLHQVPGLALGTTYSVSVRARVGGEWTPYGSSCDLTLDDLPEETYVKAAFCDTEYSLENSGSRIDCRPVISASQYEFLFSSSALTDDQVVSSSNHILFLYNAPFLENGNDYQVSVRARIGEVWGEFGDSCPITVGSLIGAAGSSENMSGLAKSMKRSSGLKIKIYPNPNDGRQFRIRLGDVTRTGVLDVLLIDMQGRTIESRRIAYNDESEMLWTNESGLESGMYIVRVIDESGNTASETMVVD